MPSPVPRWSINDCYLDTALRARLFQQHEWGQVRKAHQPGLIAGPSSKQCHLETHPGSYWPEEEAHQPDVARCHRQRCRLVPSRGRLDRVQRRVEMFRAYVLQRHLDAKPAQLVQREDLKSRRIPVFYMFIESTQSCKPTLFFRVYPTMSRHPQVDWYPSSPTKGDQQRSKQDLRCLIHLTNSSMPATEA